MSSAGAHVVVTGASTGIGRCTALRLAAGGHHVYAGVRRPQDAQTLRQDAPANLTPIELDITRADQITTATAQVAGHVGDAGLAGLVNNAGIGLFGPLELLSLDRFRHQLEVNVTGQLAVTQAFLPLLRRARGRLVFIGSIGDRMTLPFVAPVAASKSAVAAMAEAFRQELAPSGIRVILIEPASINTEAVGKLEADGDQALRSFPPAGTARYGDAFRSLLAAMAARERQGSPPDVVAQTVTLALTTPRPRARYLVGKDSRRLALIAALLPAPAQDALRRRLFGQPAPSSNTA